MPLNLIQGPPNSGRAGRIRRALTGVLDREPVLVVPNVDDVERFQDELCAGGGMLGAEVTTFDSLFRAVATAGAAPPRPVLTAAQRLGAVAAAVAEQRAGLRPLRGSASQPGFPVALERLLDELQGAGLEPAAVEAEAGTLEGSAYLGDVSTLFAGYAAVRDRLDLTDRHAVARGAIELLGAGGVEWWSRPVFIYGFDDLTRNQLDLVRALAAVDEVTVALPYEKGNAVLEERTAPLLESLEEIGVQDTEELDADPENTPDAPLLFHLERGFGAAEPERMPPDDSLILLRSAGERGEAEAIAAEVARLLADGAEPEEIAIVVRDPGRRGPLLASVLESYGVPVALEAEVSAGTTAVGGSLVALLEALLGTGRAADLLRYLRGPSGASPGRVDWFERRVRRTRTVTATAALELWEEQFGELPDDVVRLREAAGAPRRARRRRSQRWRRRWAPRTGSELEARAARSDLHLAGRARRARGPRAQPRLARPGALGDPRPDLARPGRRAGEDRRPTAPAGRRASTTSSSPPFRTASSRAAARSAPTPSSPSPSAVSLGLPRVARPRPRSATCSTPAWHCRAGGSSSPTATATRTGSPRPPRHSSTTSAACSSRRRGARAPTRSRPGSAAATSPGSCTGSPTRRRRPSWRARSRRAAPAPTRPPCSRSRASRARSPTRIGARLDAAARAEAASRAPGPLSNPAVIEALGDVPAYGGTTLEGFDVCSYRWFVSHELSPATARPGARPAPPGRHRARGPRRASTGSGPAATPSPGRARLTPGSAAAASWSPRPPPTGRWASSRPSGRCCAASKAGSRASSAEEARRDAAGFEPWLLEAGFSDAEETERPALEIDDWRLHGAIDRVDRSGGRPRPRPSITSSPPRSPRAKSSRRRRSCSCSST